MGDESGAVAGLLQREVDELLVREAGADAHFRFRAGTVVRGARGWSSDGKRRDEKDTEWGKATRTRGPFHLHPQAFVMEFLDREKSFRHGLFFKTKILPSVAFVTICIERCQCLP